jgi:hypothetical protein
MKMLKVKNDNITVARGETSMLTYTGVKRNGAPYMLAPRIPGITDLKDRKDYAVLAFTVRTSAYGEIALAKYFDLEAPPMYEGVTDYSSYGFHKFTTQEIIEVTELSEVTEYDKLYHLTGTESYVTRILKNDGTSVIKHYRFELQIPFIWDELEKLEPKEYVYDITLYYGQLTPNELLAMVGLAESDGFPLVQDINLVKIPLVTLHKFIVEDSNNV